MRVVAQQNTQEKYDLERVTNDCRSALCVSLASIPPNSNKTFLMQKCVAVYTQTIYDLLVIQLRKISPLYKFLVVRRRCAPWKSVC